jgi:hypothetical protein
MDSRLILAFLKLISNRGDMYNFCDWIYQPKLSSML